MRRLVASVRLGLAALALPFVGWLFLYGMVLGGLHALLGVAALLPVPPRGWIADALRVLVLLAGVLTVPLIGLPEYAATTNALHCRTLGFTGARAPADCAPEDVAEGARVAREGGPLFSARERLGVHGFNLLLAAGALPFGLPEVAWETAAMSWTPDTLPADATTAQRRARCRSATLPEGALAAREADSDFPMRSASVRRSIAAALPRLGAQAGARVDAGAVHFVHASSNNEGYAAALLQDSVRVALALEVDDSRLALERRADGRIDVTWSGSLSYPGVDVAFAVPLPTLLGPRTLRVSEAVFCGMHIDGAMAPYTLDWRWTLDPDDPRLHALKDQSEHTLLEALGVALLR